MTSRDGSNRNNRPIRNPDPAPRAPERQGAQWELDAEDLNRYMSGQPSKQPRFDPYGRSQTSGRTERPQQRQPQPPQQQPQQRQPTQQQQPQPQYDDYATDEEDDWTDEEQRDTYQDQPYEQPAPVRTRTERRQPRQATRQRAPEPEYTDDDLYEDPYVLDDDETPRRPSRPAQRAPRPRRERPSAGFALPAAITNAPIVSDRITLGMIGVLLVSIITMVIVVATRNDQLQTLIFTHVNANGEPVNIQGTSAAWRMPLIAGMMTLINGILAWFVSRWGTFLPRFLLGGAIGVHFVVWVAIFAYFF